jgi:hypothetical protein
MGVALALSAEDGLEDPAWQDRALRHERYVSWGALGARRATEAELQALRDSILEIARNRGFPGLTSPSARRDFDTDVAALLGGGELVPEAEALRDDVWSWIATILLPEIVLWRFSRAEARFRGGVRNTFQRLWARGAALDRGDGDGRWALLDMLPEDAQVQIFERPGLSGSIRVARGIAEGWARARIGRESHNLEDVTRHAVLLLRASNQVLSLDALADDCLEQKVDQVFRTALAAEA